MSYRLFFVSLLRTEHLSPTFRRLTFGSPDLPTWRGAGSTSG